MILSGLSRFDTRSRINIHPTELLSTLPAPRATTACTKVEPTRFGLETTCKDIIASIIFQAPARTPWTLFCVVGHPMLWLQDLSSSLVTAASRNPAPVALFLSPA